ncbi:UDP-N-acetylmuramoylalanine--D-glutamate ligase [Salsuginibacillus halophilus]|uniref:UDP-N-acetylmuramoylalanine--D-glutamate ligase n=1 Tax=Salsuginibacillus halophilus TaxID=517424 RepID=A0A2P8HX33_9BACI|nr:UDP-N-acetylmuramoyl-L-alanine--D-glutamate ligase [Salsuginibacillus halophilus]PSL50772.1 UDP-N-acetylmuramoylalanine--D-glutamate ligase [Salsuginibacillus halophilus]
MRKEDVQGAHCLVLGMAKSGKAAARLLKKLGAATVTINDAKPKEELHNIAELEAEGIGVVAGGHPLTLLDEQTTCVVKNPGIPYNNPLVHEALERGLSVVTEIELAHLIRRGSMMAITGSNGKTTTTTLIHAMLEADGTPAKTAGNIGQVACETAEKLETDEVMVTEVSSFQLKGTETFRPETAVLLNIFDAHLDYHGTKEDYVASKLKLLQNLQSNETVVYNVNDPYIRPAAQASLAVQIPFDVDGVVQEGAYIQAGQVMYQDEIVIEVSEIKLPGAHNLENILAAVAAVKSYGGSNEAIAQVLRTFSGVEHRLELIAEKSGRMFYNDSKATNILATTKALHAFKEPVVLLAGGLDRGTSFDELVPALNGVKALVAFGETKSALKTAALEAGVANIYEVDKLEEAVIVANDTAETGDVVLLSPACASWDQYKTFEERGEHFVKLVHQLT